MGNEKKTKRQAPKRKPSYLVVIPYLPSAAQGRELDYAIAGWQKHFKEKHTIVVVGEGLPKIDLQGVVCIESERVAPIEGQYRQHLDYVSCLRKVRAAFPGTDGCIFVGDDCYAVNDFDISDVKFLKMIAPEIDFEENSPNPWKRDKMKTKKALIAAGLPVGNYTTHIPIWYDWDKLEELWDKYDMEHSSYVVEDLYFNTFFKDRLPYIINPVTDHFKCGLSDNELHTILAMRKAPSWKIWITNTPEGWMEPLDELLRNHYGI